MSDVVGGSLFAQLRDRFPSALPTFRASSATLVDISHALEDLVLQDRLSSAVAVGFDPISDWEAEEDRLRRMAEVAQLVCLFTAQQPPASAGRLVAATLGDNSALRQEHFFLVSSEHIAALLCARMRQDDFEAFFTYDPAVVARGIEALVAHTRASQPERADTIDAAFRSFPPPQPNSDYAARIMAMVMEHSQQRQDQLQEVVDESERLRATQGELEQMLMGLAVPVIPLVPGVLVVPLVGNVDSRRSQQVMEALLEGISTQQADVAILDVTGVPLIDTNVANNLLQTVRAANMLGASVIITGIGADIAQTLVHLEVDFARLRTAANLQAGIEAALGLRGLEIRPAGG
jgi:rsbT co-antagonist protein RsbR